MDVLISKQAAIDALGEEPEVWSGNDEYAQGLNNQWHHDVNALKALPPAQPERCEDCVNFGKTRLLIPQPEQKTGHWIQNDNGTWSCDQCQSWIPDEQHYYARFCLYCGAEMWVAERDACDGCKTCEFYLHEYWNCQGDKDICPVYLANFIQTEEDEDGGL